MTNDRQIHRLNYQLQASKHFNWPMVGQYEVIFIGNKKRFPLGPIGRSHSYQINKRIFLYESNRMYVCLSVCSEWSGLLLNPYGFPIQCSFSYGQGRLILILGKGTLLPSLGKSSLFLFKTKFDLIFEIGYLWMLTSLFI